MNSLQERESVKRGAKRGARAESLRFKEVERNYNLYDHIIIVNDSEILRKESGESSSLSLALTPASIPSVGSSIDLTLALYRSISNSL